MRYVNTHLSKAIKLNKVIKVKEAPISKMLAPTAERKDGGSPPTRPGS